VCAAIVGASLATASAATASFIPEIDLRDSAHAAAHGFVSYSMSWGGFGIRFDSLSIESGSLSSADALYWSAEDGFGIQGSGYERDEIEAFERLRVAFDEPILLERLLISDLFIEDQTETGAYSLDGGLSWISFAADGLDPNGEIEVSVQAEVSSLLLAAPGKAGLGNHEFSLAGFDAIRIANPNAIPQVPEPSSGALVAIALIGLALRPRWHT
jgi:hypothetical protein